VDRHHAREGLVPTRPERRHLIGRNKLALAAVTGLLLVGGTAGPASATLPPGLAGIQFESLSGSGNNVAHPDWGAAGTNYLRVGAARYADGRGTEVSGPNPRFISNRVYNDLAQNVFSDRGISQWGTTWGQFLDHTFGLRSATGEADNIPFNANDPLESFTNDFGVIQDNRSPAAPGTGVTNPREQINTENAFLDAEVVYGHDANRLEWLREGPVDGNMANNGPHLLLSPSSYLPAADQRGNAAAAPAMDVDGRLRAVPNTRKIAGDPRANEVIQLTATQTLFAREHNRVVDLLPNTLSSEEKFQIARKVVAAEEQYITYTEFLPAMGVNLPAYAGYNANVNPGLTNEFAAMGYRAHSMNHGEALDADADLDRYSTATLNSLRAQGAEVTVDGDEVGIIIPLGVGFFNPNLVEQIQLGPVLEGIGNEAEYNNDPLIDNQLRSVLFQVPVSGNPECLDGPTLPQCFRGVQDLAAIDIQRGRDHGLPSYNQMRQAYGLAPRTSFTAITGEATDQFPADPLLTRGNEINDPNSIDNTALFDTTGDTVVPGSDDADGNVKRITRRTTLAARLRAIYGSVDNVDSFVGMSAEPHTAGTELGELQRAIWAKQFGAMRDGDRFFFGNDPALTSIRNLYGIDFRQTLSKVIGANTDVGADLPPNVFFAGGQEKPSTCTVAYQTTGTWPGHFQINMKITNTGSTPINRWQLKFSYANGQTIDMGWNGDFVQEDRKVTVNNATWNGAIPPGGSLDGVGFNGSVPGAANARPAALNVNTTNCSVVS
jgi:Animal haem peroxidase/Cellulose binding domain